MALRRLNSLVRQVVVNAQSCDAVEDEIKSIVSQHKLVMFVRASYCPFCEAAENALNDAKIPFHKVVAGEAGAPMRLALQKMTGQQSVPNGWAAGKFIGGCSDGPEPWMGFLPLIANGKLKEMIS